MTELRQLAVTAGARVIGETVQNLKRIHSKFFIGTGKAKTILELIPLQKINIIIFDHNLSPSQQSHLEELFKIKVIDRTGLILDIFAKRARSREGKLQVELAQLSYLYTRLKGGGVEMSRLGGGIGTRGPGEMKREIERRVVRDRISLLKKEIQMIKRTRTMHRKKRQGVPIPIVALMGYTNSGKSTLLNQLTDSDVLVEDKLFATLDPTTRHVFLPNKQKILVTDTVGFIRKLPTQLIEAFRATLEEVTEADLLLHVIDISHPEFERQIEEVEETLKILDIMHKPTLYVYNKVDRVDDPRMIFLKHKRRHPFVIISASKRRNFEKLFEGIQAQLSSFLETIDVKIPIEAQKLLSQIYAQGEVLEKKFFKKSIRIKARVPHAMANQLRKK